MEDTISLLTNLKTRFRAGGVCARRMNTALQLGFYAVFTIGRWRATGRKIAQNVHSRRERRHKAFS
jgi:hypothetical protein